MKIRLSGPRGWMSGLLFGALGAGLIFASAAMAGPQTKKTGAAKAPAKAAGEQPKFKAIWEPVNFKQDIGLTDVYFVNDTTGWASGEKGTLIKTTDGGDTWTVILGGDPAAKEEPIRDLRFLDATHGWATKYQGGGKLLRTTDGENWEQFGKIGEAYGFYYDFVFLTERIGVQLVKEGSDIARTTDGGKTWKVVADGCAVNAEVEGLSRKLGCNRKSFFFLSPEIGYAIGATIPGTNMVLFRTEDGGMTWTPQVVPDVGHPDESHFEQWLYFTDANSGFAVLPRADKFLATSDGGKTWRGVIASVKGPLKFAAQVGWSFDQYGKWTYTTDGGKRWASVAMRFPAYVKAYSLPSPQRGYMVGDHGMVYRYRIVPVEYSSKGMIAAAMMPAKSP